MDPCTAMAIQQTQEADMRKETAAERDLSCTGLSIYVVIFCGIRKIFLWLPHSSVSGIASHPACMHAHLGEDFVFLLPPLAVITNA